MVEKEKMTVSEAVEVNRETLNKLTVKELIQQYATPLQIVGRHDMRKSNLVQAILDLYVSQIDEGAEEAANETSNEVDDVTTKDVSKEVKKQPRELTEVQKINKARYVDEADVGTIIAFKLPGMKVKSAKIIRRSTKNKKFKVQTAYGVEYVVSFDEVIWVKTNKRWPKGVYNLLKGKVE